MVGTNKITKLDFGNNSMIRVNSMKSDALFEKLLTVEDLAVAFGKAPQTIRNMVAARQIPFLRIGRETKFRRESIEAWLEQKEFKLCR